MATKSVPHPESAPKAKRAPAKSKAAAAPVGAKRKTTKASPTPPASEQTGTAATSGARTGPKAMSAGHKASLAIGREEGRAVRRYLEALDAHRPKRGRKRSADGVARRLAAIEDSLARGADPLTRLHLFQERMDLRRELAAGGGEVDLSAAEGAFTAVAAAYSERKGVSYDAWRQLGVEGRVLSAAGIRRRP